MPEPTHMPSFSSPLEREAAVSTFVPPRAAFLSARRFNRICRSYQNFQRAQLAPLSPQEIQLGHLGGMCADYCSFLPAPDISGTRKGRLRRMHATAAVGAGCTHTHKQGQLWQDLPQHHYTPVCNPPQLPLRPSPQCPRGHLPNPLAAARPGLSNQRAGRAEFASIPSARRQSRRM